MSIGKGDLSSTASEVVSDSWRAGSRGSLYFPECGGYPKQAEVEGSGEEGPGKL